MLRIRRIHDDVLPVNREALKQVKEILRARFSEAAESEIEQIGEKLRNPFKQRFRTSLIVAENLRRKVLAFAMLLHEPEIGFCYLDWIATAGGQSRGGLGSALYDRVRGEAAALNARGLFFECLPDDDAACPDRTTFKDNQARLRFYEGYGARPIVNTVYEAPVKPGDTCMPHLVYDGLDRPRPLSRAFAQKVVRAVLERKYAAVCPPDYVEMVVKSFRDDPVRLREFRYFKPEAAKTTVAARPVAEQIALVVNDRHKIHHVHERGYVESPVRVASILTELEKTGLFTRIKPHPFPEKQLSGIHDPALIQYLRRASAGIPEGKSLYPYVFPIRNKTRPPKEPSVLSGYYCIDTFTPINRDAYTAARRAVDCALTAAGEILAGRRIAYALVRPPGHHAERKSFGGFCYFNNNATAAHYLSAYGKVAILDIDYHHGNGQQDIFYRRADVLTVSIHGHPKFAYPYFAGFEDERGLEDGEGFNMNLPLPETVDGEGYRKALARAILRVEQFKPHFLVVALGLDTAKHDPTGTWMLTAKDFEANGRMIGEMDLPTVVVQEGGYRTRTLGINARHFFTGLAAASAGPNARRPAVNHRLHGVMLRESVEAQDVDRVRRLVRLTGFFSPEAIELAVERIADGLSQGSESGYRFLFAEHYGRMAGYLCYGPVACTRSTHAVHWITVHPDFQGRGLGRRLMAETERRIRDAGGTRVYVETGPKAQHAGVHTFFERTGYEAIAVLPDFYGPGEGKTTFFKALAKARG